MPGQNRIAQQKRKAQRKARNYRPEADKGRGVNNRSRYGRKRAFLNSHGGFGTDYPDKPWR